MYYNVLKLEDLVDNKQDQFSKNVFMEHGESSLTLIGVKKDAVIDRHISVCDAAAYVIDGEIEIHFDAEKFKLKKGEIIMFKKEHEHKVLALKDSKFLLIKI